MEKIFQAEVPEGAETQKGKYLTFSLGSELYGINIGYVTEIVGLQRINPIPDSPDYIKGVINLRGNIIPVIDMNLKFGKAETPLTDRACTVVVQLQEQTVGLIVEQVRDVESIPDRLIDPTPEFSGRRQSNLLKGIGKSGENLRLILDCEHLFINQETAIH